MDFIWYYVYGGINSTSEFGGSQCVEFLPLWQRIIETLVVVPLAICGIIISSRNLEVLSILVLKLLNIIFRLKLLFCIGYEIISSYSEALPDIPTSEEVPTSISKDDILSSSGKNLIRYSVLAFYCFIFGSEIVYKLARRVGILLLNQCHIATTIQILLLTLGTSNHRMCFLFRFHMYLLSGAFMGIIFPVINFRVFPAEMLVYFIQHIAVIIVPFVIVYINGTFLLESFRNSAWSILSFSIILIYYFIVLQVIGWITEANVGCMMCPIASDPFNGRFYRLAGVIHQGILVPLLAKICNFSIKYVFELVHSFGATRMTSIFVVYQTNNFIKKIE